VPFQKWPICPISALREKFNPRNITHMPPVKFFARLDLEQICHSWKGTNLLSDWRTMTMMNWTTRFLILAFGLGLILPALSPPPVFALEKSSKKECALCHVMWLDVFRTNKETLIKWQPGNVLMKDTQGIVSSEEICYSCHDGYVADARFTVWKAGNHPVFKKPSPKVKIPPALTLSNKDEVYCGTCHSPHSGRKAAPGSSPEETIPGPLSFLRLPNIDSSLCEACHVNEADFKRTHSHPVHTDKLKIPDALFARGSVAARKKDTVTCQTCHAVHGAQGRHLTVMDNSQSALCAACHKERSIAGTRHDVRRTMPDEKNILGQPVSESGPCGACHVPHRSAGYKLWARKIPPGNPASQACLACHTNTPKSKIRSIGRYSHPIDIGAVPKALVRKAPAPSLKTGLPAFSPAGRHQAAGSVQCATCHDAHQWSPGDPADKGAGKIAGDGANSFLRISAGRSSSLCLACHQDKQQLLAFDHNLVRTAPQAKNMRGATAAVSGPCGACHLAHNAAGPRLWARTVLGDKKGAPTPYCTGCHGPEGPAKAKPVGKHDHPVDVKLKGNGIPSPGAVTGKLPLYSAAGSAQPGNRITCRTCHDPHIWSPGGKVAEPAPVPGKTPDEIARNLEGDAASSFLRSAASPGPDLCVVCHPDTALLVGTDHDLFVTAPTAKNQLGQTVAQSGPCGACHVAHHSRQDRLIWARAYGPVAKDQHSMNGLCTGCHSKGGPAEDKIPPVATHPKGKLIDNILTARGSTGYIKIFDDHWKETRAGDLSCSSCHSFYQWDHRVRKPGPGRNVEGDADTSFLRASRDRLVCTDCHGQTAIWRYLYFHSQKKRAMLKGVRP
jgi:predicted CXXCH cytochrome family protein